MKCARRKEGVKARIIRKEIKNDGGDNSRQCGKNEVQYGGWSEGRKDDEEKRRVWGWRGGEKERRKQWVIECGKRDR